MTEVMNRTVRRAARPKGDDIETGIYVVPMELVEWYYRTQIASEGFWNPDPPVIVMRPVKAMHRADDAWFAETLAQMREVREPGTNRYVFPAEEDRPEIDIDIGLIDVQFYFNAYRGVRRGSPLTDANFRRLHRLCGGRLNTQMVMATAVHHYRPDGSATLHYHNLIFALRKQIEPDEHVGVIDLLPLVKALGDGRTLHIIDDS